jgi:hypothetical protein
MKRKVTDDGRTSREKRMAMVVLAIDHSLSHSNRIRPFVGDSHLHGRVRRNSVGNNAAPQE